MLIGQISTFLNILEALITIGMIGDFKIINHSSPPDVIFVVLIHLFGLLSEPMDASLLLTHQEGTRRRLRAAGRNPRASEGVTAESRGQARFLEDHPERAIRSVPFRKKNT